MTVKRQAGQLDLFADGRVLRAVHGDGQFLGDDADLVARLDIAVVKKTSGQDLQIAYEEISPADAKHHDVALFAAGHGYVIVILDHGRGVADAGNALAHRTQVVEGQEVAGGVAIIDAAAGILGHHHVGADVLNLLQQVLLSGQPDGDDQDERRRPDHHAQRGQDETDLADAEGLDGDTEGLAEDQLGISPLLAVQGHLQR